MLSGDPLEQHVGVGLEPDRLGAAGGLGRLDHRGHLARSAGAGAQRVQAAVGRDAVEPGAQRGSPLEAVESAPGSQERLLQQVLGVLQRADDPVAVHLQLAPVGVGELAKRVLVARPGTGEYVRIGGHHMVMTPFVLEKNRNAGSPTASRSVR